MKKIFLILFILVSLGAKSQIFNITSRVRINGGFFQVDTTGHGDWQTMATRIYADSHGGGGGGAGTVNSGTINTLGYYAATGTTISSLTAITASRLLVSNSSGLPVASSVTTTEAGYLAGVTSAIQTQFSNTQPLDATLSALALLNASGGILTQTGLDAFTKRTLTGTTGRLVVTFGDGISGNPTFDIDASYVGQSSINTLGVVTTGQWQSTNIGIAYGGTGSSLVDPNVDKLMYWNDGSNTVAFLGINANDFQIVAGVLQAVPFYYKNVVSSDSVFFTRNGEPDALYARAFHIAVGSNKVTAVESLVGDSINVHTIDVVEANLSVANMGGILGASHGGTGINNGSSTITLGGSLTFSGAFTFAATLTAATAVTFPTTGTLYGTATGSITSLQLFTSLTNPVGTGSAVFATAPTFVTSITDPLHIGGTGTTSTLTFKTTTGVGAAGADMIFQVGNNGATEAMRILNSGFIGINISPSYRLDVLNGTTAQTATNRILNVAATGSTFNTTSSTLASYGIYSLNTSSRSSGANALTNVGVYGEASSAQVNIGIYGKGGTGANDWAALFDGSISFNGQLSSVEVTLTDASTVTWDWNSGTNATVTLGGNRTLSVSNARAGTYATIKVVQDGTGSRTLALPASSKVIGGGAGAITLTTTAAAVDILTVYYNGTSYFWTYGKNYN